MYFWRIGRLEEDLAASRVGERESLHYLLWLGGATTVASLLPVEYSNLWDHLDAAAMLLVFLVGTGWTFARNGGTGGRDFLVRYVSLSWVFGIRFVVLVAMPVIVLLFVAEAWLLPGGVPASTTPWEWIAFAALDVAFYLRLGEHFREVATAAERSARA